MEYAIHITFDRRGRLPFHLHDASWDDTTARCLRVLSAFNLVCFCVVFDHLHVLLLVDRETAGRAAHALECSLGWAHKPDDCEPRTWWNPPRYTPIRDARHLRDTLAYILDNGVKSLDVAYPLPRWRWSSAWNPLGLRFSAYELVQSIPETSRSATASVVFGDARWQPEPVPQISSPLEALGHLLDVARLAMGVAPGAEVDRAERRVLLSFARLRGWPDAAIGPSVGISERSLRRIASVPPEEPRMLAARSLLPVLGSTPIDDAPPQPRPVRWQRTKG